MSVPLEPTDAERRALLEATYQFIADFYSELDDLPLSGQPLADDDHTLLRMPPGEEGTPFDRLLSTIGVANQAGSLHPSGGHLAYIPNGGLYTAALGAFLASALNRYTGVPLGAPGLNELEGAVLRWMEELFELNVDEASGILLSGGSTANLTALVAARTARLGEDFLGGRIYVSPHVHHSVTKAARLAGFPASALRTVAVDDELRMDPAALVAAVREDRAQGREPFMLVGSAGTTDSGAVDPLSDLATIAREQHLWFHVDAAYGGFFQLTERGRKRLVGIGSADSITLDPHKGLSIPFGVGALLVRDRATLIEANSGKGAYLQDQDDGGIDFSALGPELTRPFRGMQVWLPLQLHGVGAFRAELDRSLDLAEHARRRLAGMDWVEHIWSPRLSIVAFRAVDDGRGRRAMEHANASGKVFLSSTSIDGRYVLRLAILNRRTTQDHVDMAIDLLDKGYRR